MKSVLAAVDVPLIVTGHNHFDRNNEVLKAVAAACAGENLLLNWVEQNNYRTIAGAAMAYGHCVVSQSPIDVNIGKQMNILLTNMDLKREQIVIDPLTGAMGYGIEYTYSVMERIRLTGLGGDAMLAMPMIVSPGQECAKIKELQGLRKGHAGLGRPAQARGAVGADHGHEPALRRRGHPDHVQPGGGRRPEARHRPADGQIARPPRTTTRRTSDGTYRSTNSKAPAEHQLQGMRLQHLPGVRHEAGRQEGRAGRVPLCLRRSQARARRGQRAARPLRRARARTGSSSWAAKSSSTATRRPSSTRPLWPSTSTTPIRLKPSRRRSTTVCRLSAGTRRREAPASTWWPSPRRAPMRQAFAALAAKAWSQTKRPLVLRSPDVGALAAAAAAVKGSRSVLCAPSPEAAAQLWRVAKENDHALAVTAPDLDQLVALAAEIKAQGFNDLFLQFPTYSLAEQFQTNSIARRAALKDNFKPLGYPTLRFIDDRQPAG